MNWRAKLMLITNFFRIVAACGLLLGLTGSIWGREKVTIQKTASNSQLRGADTWLDRANPTNNNGNSSSLQVRSLAGANAQRTLVQFDLSAVPNAGVKIATLTLNVLTPPSGGRTYEAHFVTNLWTELDASWNNRMKSTAWGAAGGNFTGAATSSIGIGAGSTSASWDITRDVQSWYNGSTNYGTLIKDSAEGAAGPGFTTTFSSKEDNTPANRPQLVMTFLQNVTNLAATASDTKVTLTWTNPTPLAISTVLENYTGVLILRSANVPVNKTTVPTDGVNPALCATIGNGRVVFDNSTNATTFTDDATDTCGAPANGTMWFYKVFARDSANNYTANGPGLAAPRDGGSTFTAEISAFPNTIGAYSSNWIAATHSTNLAAPGLIPGTKIEIGSGTNLVLTIDANTGLRSYPPVSVGGPITDRLPVLESTDASIGANVTYIANQDNFVYAVDINTGQILWVVNPTGLATNAFQGAAAVQVKSFSGVGYTLAHDLVIVGTRNGATTTANRIVGLDGNTGATLWQVVGNSGTTPALDMISSTPLVDYVNGAIWVTSRSAGGAAQPSLWKLNPNTGAVLFSANLGDIDGSPTLTGKSDVLFVGTNGGLLYAINPVTGATLKNFNGADGAIVGFPVPVSFSSPFNVIFSTTTRVQAVSFNATTNTFTALWSTPINGPSAPIVFVNNAGTVAKVYVGSADGKIHELDLVTGVDGKQRIANTGQPGIVGDPSIDGTLNRIYVSTNDQRAYSFTVPF